MRCRGMCLWVAGQLWVMTALAWGQAEIAGTVTDGEGATGICGVTVYLENTEYGAYTDGEGRYLIPGVPAGTYALRLAMIGYRKESLPLVVEDKRSLRLDFTLEVAPIHGEEVVITATRTPRRIKEVPVRTEIITSVRMAEKAATNVYEALQSEPGVRVEQQCSNCNFSILRVEGLEGGYTQTLIDGQPIFTGLAGVYGLQQIQAGNIERIEVVKGSGSALYGSDALAGVVNIITRRPGALPSLSIGTQLGEHGTHQVHVNGSMRRGSIGIVFSAQKDMGDGIDETGGEAGPSFHDTGQDGYTDRVETSNLGVGTTIYWYEPLGAHSEIKAFGRVQEEARVGGNLATWEDPFDPDSEQISTLRYETGVNLEKRLRAGPTVEVHLTYVNHDREATNGAAWDKAVGAGMLDEDLNLTDAGRAYMGDHGYSGFRQEWHPKPYLTREEIHFADLGISQPFGIHDLLAGLQYRHSDLGQTINGDPSDKQADDLGLYLQGDFHLRQNLETVVGVRFDRHSSQDELTGGDYEETAVNPRVGLRYSPHVDVAVRANIGMGFRVPYLFSEDMHLCASAPRIYKSGDLKAERAVNASLGVDVYRIDYRLGLSVFRTVIDDKVEFVSAEGGQVPEGYDYQWQNLGQAVTQGLEMTFGGTVGRWMDCSANLVYTDAAFDEPRFDRESYPGDDDGWKHSDRIPRSPAWTGGLSTTLKHAGWSLYTSANYTGPMYIDHAPGDDAEQLMIEKTDGYALVDAKLGKRLAENVTAYAGAKNLLGYTQPTRDNSDAAYIYAPLYGQIVYFGFQLAIR